jgi:uncharacterized protein YbjQ (UPF0145 family)
MSTLRLRLCACVMLFAACAPAAEARDTVLHLPFKDLFEDAQYRARLGSDVAFYFGNQAVPGTPQGLAEVVTNRKTNSFGKPDVEACRWAALAALLQLAERARELGGDAVVDVRSFYKKVEFVSDTDYECHAGGIVAGLALKARIVKLKK